jgi:hypothetical protein
LQRGGQTKICIRNKSKMRKQAKTKAQSIVEYGISVAVVILATIALQAYVRRGLQGRFVDVIATSTAAARATTQYEPYYLDFQEGTDTEGTVMNRQINTNFQTGGRLRTDIVTESNTVPIRIKTEGINSYADN